MATPVWKSRLAAVAIATSVISGVSATLPPTAEAATVRYIEKPCVIKSYTGGRTCALYGQPVWVQLGKKSQLPFYISVAKQCAAGGVAAVILTKGVGGAQTFFLGCVANLAQAAIIR